MPRLLTSLDEHSLVLCPGGVALLPGNETLPDLQLNTHVQCKMYTTTHARGGEGGGNQDFLLGGIQDFLLGEIQDFLLGEIHDFLLGEIQDFLMGEGDLTLF